jgi:hypothetical protein
MLGITGEEEFVASAAEAQIEQEKEGENAFMKLLDYLTRPQRAIAGVLTDLIDGGDFSPLDRVGQALLGEEDYGMKDFIDVVSPGKWSNMRLPGWLGGKKIDPFKESVGFLGDIFTDPLMALRTFTVAGKSVQGAEELAKASKWMKRSPQLTREFTEHVEKVKSAKKAATSVSGSYINEVYGLRKLEAIYREATRNPEEFIKKLPEGAARQDFINDMFDIVGRPIREVGRSVSERIEHAGLLNAKIPWLTKALGLPNDALPLTPKIADRMAAAVSKGIGEFMEDVALTPKGGKFRQFIMDTLKWSSGDPRMDMLAIQMAAHSGKMGKELQGDLVKITKAMEGHYDDASQDLIRHHMMHEWGENFGRKYTNLESQPDWVRKPVEIWRQTAKSMYGVAGKNPLATVRSMSRQLSPRQSHKAMMTRIEAEMPEMAHTFKSYGRVRDEMKRVMKARTEGKEIGAEEFRKLRGDVFDDIMEYEHARSAMFLNSTEAYKETGYFPRFPTDEVNDDFLKWFKNDTLTYGGTSAYAHLVRAIQGRAGPFAELNTDMINQAWREGVFPHKFWDDITRQAKTKLGGKQRKAWERWLGALDPDQRAFYIDDPSRAIAARMYDHVRGVSRADMTLQAMRMGAVVRNAEDFAKGTYMGETWNVLSPKGMEAWYGKNWRAEIGADAADQYDILMKKMRIRPDNDLQGVFLDMRNDPHEAFAHAFKHKIPVFGVPDHIKRGLNKFLDYSSSPEHMNRFLKFTDEITDFWKATTLAIFPAYHSRNALGQMWQAFLADSLSPQNYVWATRFLWSSGLAKEGWPIGRQTLAKPGLGLDSLALKYGDVTYTGDALVDYTRNLGFLEGMMTGELQQYRGIGIQAKKRGKVAAAGRQLTQYGVPIKAMFNAGNMFESIHRLALFRDRLLKGFSPFEAGQDVKKFFYSAREMSKFDANVMARGFPFWRWTRNNVPLQARALLSQPGKFGQLARFVEFFQSDEGKRFDRKLLPKWTSEQFGVTTRINKKTGDVEAQLLRSWIPAMDLMAIVNSKPIHSIARTGMSLLHPIPKGLIEQHINKSFFTGREIEEFPGEPYPMRWPTTFGPQLSKRAVHALKTFRLPSELHRIFQETTPTGEVQVMERLMSASGIVPKVKAFDVETLRKSYKFDVAKRKAVLKRKLNRAKKFGNKEFTDYFRNLLEDVSGNAN